MEQLLYNPDAMSEADIRATFVGREALLDELLDLIEHQPNGAGVQHIVLIAPRGMGKTTLLLMLKFALNDRGLQDRWQAVKFPEESYGITDLADFFIEVVRLLASETGDTALARRADELAEEHPDSEALQEIALALLKDWRRQHGKRLLLLVENIDLMLEQIGDERANARLRDVLMNDGTLLLIGAATTFFLEARAYEQPLYNFFKLYNLADLDFDQMQELLRKRADLDGVADFEQVLRSNRSRLRALEYFTGGNPRLVLILYRVVTQSDITEVRSGLEKLLDEVTPYYKAKIESLPPQQRKILDQIARITGTTSEAVTPGEIARQVRLPPNQVSAQLKRLSELGYVRAADLRGRHTYYTLSEPLYAIWHQMRMGRDARRRMGWLVNFLKVWYTAEEISIESEKLGLRFQSLLQDNQSLRARDVLEHHRYLAAATDDSEIRNNILEAIIPGYIELQDIDMIKQDLLKEVMLEELSHRTLLLLLKNSCISKNQLSQALNLKKQSPHLPKGHEVDKIIADAVDAHLSGRHQEALNSLSKALESRPKSHEIWDLHGAVLATLGRHIEALSSFEHATQIKPDFHVAYFRRGVSLIQLHRFVEAIKNFDRALEIDPNMDLIHFNRGIALFYMHKFNNAIDSFSKALKSRPDKTDYLFANSIALMAMGKFDKAIESLDYTLKSIKGDNDSAKSIKSDVLLTISKSHFELGNIDAAYKIWLDAWHELPASHRHAWQDMANDVLIRMASKGYIDFARKLITETSLEEPLLPLARALDYLQTGDDSLIEKLSPEVRGIARDIIARLQRQQEPAQRPAGKTRSARARPPRLGKRL